MPVRTNYKDNIQNRPVTRRVTPQPEETSLPTKDPCEACKRCPYKRLVEKALNDEPVQVVPVITKQVLKPEPTTQYIQPNVPVQQVTQVPQQPTQPLPKPVDPNEKVGVWTKFSRYVAKNRAANKARGETTITEDLSKTGSGWLKGISDGMAKVGESEANSMRKTKSAKVQDPDELIDFLSGKRKK